MSGGLQEKMTSREPNVGGGEFLEPYAIVNTVDDGYKVTVNQKKMWLFK